MTIERDEDHFSWMPGDVEWETPPPASPPPFPADPTPPLRDASGLTVTIKEHGELGPLLVNADHDFTQL